MHAVAPVELLPLAARHLPYAVRLHRHALSSGLFPRLGPRFLARYHETFLTSPYAVALVAVAGSAPVGFLLGTSDNAAHYRWVLQNHGRRLAVTGAVALLTRPRVALHVVRTRLHRYLRARRLLERHDPAAPDRDQRRAVLTHVAVSSDARGAGIGAALVQEYVARVDGADRPAIVVSTTADDTGATGFYECLGWRKERIAPDADGELVVELSWPT